jgi:hypothetical protein
MNRQLVNRTARSKIVSFSIGLMLLTAGIGASIGAPKKHPEPINVGMIPLLASPEKYNGKIIRTIGFLHVGPMHESDILCLYEDDGKFSLFKNTFALDLSDDQRKQFLPLNHTYVLITGTLHSEGAEGTKMNSGIIVNITQIDGWQPYKPSSPTTAK